MTRVAMCKRKERGDVYSDGIWPQAKMHPVSAFEAQHLQFSVLATLKPAWLGQNNIPRHYAGGGDGILLLHDRATAFPAPGGSGFPLPNPTRVGIVTVLVDALQHEERRKEEDDVEKPFKARTLVSAASSPLRDRAP
jgi:hypothetical protein